MNKYYIIQDYGRNEWGDYQEVIADSVKEALSLYRKYVPAHAEFCNDNAACQLAVLNNDEVTIDDIIKNRSMNFKTIVYFKTGDTLLNMYDINANGTYVSVKEYTDVNEFGKDFIEALNETIIQDPGDIDFEFELEDFSNEQLEDLLELYIEFAEEQAELEEDFDDFDEDDEDEDDE